MPSLTPEILILRKPDHLSFTCPKQPHEATEAEVYWSFALGEMPDWAGRLYAALHDAIPRLWILIDPQTLGYIGLRGIVTQADIIAEAEQRLALTARFCLYGAIVREDTLDHAHHTEPIGPGTDHPGPNPAPAP